MGILPFFHHQQDVLFKKAFGNGTLYILWCTFFFNLKLNNMKKTNFLTALAVMTGLFILTSCEKDNEEMTAVKDMTVAEYVSYDPNFSTLLQALYK